MTKQEYRPAKAPAMQEEKCPNCGMPKGAWQGNGGQGFSMGGKTYCCQGCAVGTGCTCG